MATLLPILPHLKPNPLLQKPQSGYGFSLKPKPKHLFFRREVGVVKLGLRPESFDFDLDGGGFRDLFGRVEGILYTIADAVVSNSDIVTDAATKQNSDWLSGITSYMETILKVLKGGLSTLHVPYAYGFAITLLTVLVKAATFPLTKKTESAMAMKSLQPQIKAIQKRYAGDQERIQLETARLYKLAKINPLAGCLPTLATIPVWIGLYRALSNVADEGLLTEGFFWIPSLAGPTTIATRQNGSGISWLFPFIDGQPPLGWSDTLAYLVLPVLLVVSQYISVQIMQSSQSNDPNMKSSQAITKLLPLMIGYFALSVPSGLSLYCNDPNMKSSQAITKLLPLMIGYFALSVPSGLSLYWFTNNILSTAQQVYLQKLGGAQNLVSQFSNETYDEEPAQILQSAVKTQVKKESSKKVEMSMPEGQRPGERFKQLKEQEARRRKQREEEKMQAEAAAAKGVKVEDQATEKEISITKSGNSAEADFLNDSNSKHLTDVDVTVNGSHSGQDLQESIGVANVHKVENSAAPASSEGDGTN